MLYLTSEHGAPTIIILETLNLERLKQGQPAHSPDKAVLIAWTPDPKWLAEQIAASGGDLRLIVKAIDEATTRPENPTTEAYFPPRYVPLNLEAKP